MGEPLQLHDRPIFPPVCERLRALAGAGATEQRIGEFTLFWPDSEGAEGLQRLLDLRLPGMPLEFLPVATADDAIVALYVSPALRGSAAASFPVVLYLPDEQAATPIASSYTGFLHFAFAACRDAVKDPEAHHRSHEQARIELEEARRIDAALTLGHRFELEIPDPETDPIRWHAAFLGFDPDAPYSLAVEAQGAADGHEIERARAMLTRAAAAAPWFAPVHITSALLEIEEHAIPAALWSFYRALATPAHGSGEGSRSPFYGLPLGFELDLDPTAFCRTYRASASPELTRAPFWDLIVDGKPEDAAAWLAHARAFVGASRELEARVALVIARDLAPAEPEPLDELAALAARTGDWLLTQAILRTGE